MVPPCTIRETTRTRSSISDERQQLNHVLEVYTPSSSSSDMIQHDLQKIDALESGVSLLEAENEELDKRTRQKHRIFIYSLNRKTPGEFKKASVLRIFSCCA